MKICQNLLEHVNENSKCEQKLRSVSGAYKCDIMTAHHLFSIKAELLKYFVRVRIAEVLWKLNEKDMPTLKGKVSDVDKVKPPVLLEVAYELRNNCVIA